MPDKTRVRCQVCKRHRNEVGPISWRGYCERCGLELAREAAANLHQHNGPKFEHWRRRLAASVGAVLVDDASETG
jgi:predicted amidophosphoribosyltransferase